MRFAILCSGQGGQHAGMFALARSNAAVAGRINAWPLETVCGLGLAEALQPQHMFANRYAQPLLISAALANWEALKTDLPPPVLIAGYSLGELTAYAVAGAVGVEEAISLAAQRARLMDATRQEEQGLFALSGLTLVQAHDLLARYGLFVAIETGDASCIAGGRQRDIQAFLGQLDSAGVRVSPLPIDVASHTPLMHMAAARFMETLRESQLCDPVVPVLSGVGASSIVSRDEAILALGRQLEQPIRWAACMDACAEAGITATLELGPGSALARMMTERHPHIAARSVDEFRSLGGVLKWIERHAD